MRSVDPAKLLTLFGVNTSTRGLHAAILGFKERKALERLLFDDRLTFGIYHKLGMRLIGSIGLIADPLSGDNEEYALGSTRTLICVLSLGRRHNGYACEACKTLISYGFEAVGLDMITGYCRSRDFAVRRLMHRCELSPTEDKQNSFSGACFPEASSIERWAIDSETWYGLRMEEEFGEPCDGGVEQPLPL